MVISDQVDEGGLDVVAKAAAARVGTPEIAAQEAQRKVLKKLRRYVRVTDGAKQVAVGGATVTL